jgi:hypothetical protein
MESIDEFCLGQRRPIALGRGSFAFELVWEKRDFRSAL